MTETPQQHEYECRRYDSEAEKWLPWFPVTSTSGTVKIECPDGYTAVEIRPWKPRWKTGKYIRRNQKTDPAKFECLWVDDEGNGYGQYTGQRSDVSTPMGHGTYDIPMWAEVADDARFHVRHRSPAHARQPASTHRTGMEVDTP